MKNKYYVCPLIIAFALAATSCKTTEKNYQAAYDVAIQKKNREKAEEAELGIDEGMLQSADGPSKRVMEGGTFYFESRKLKRPDTSEVLRGKYCVVIASYKMPTNCNAQVKDMQEKGYPAFAAQDGDGKYYVVIGEFPSMKEAARFSAEYVKKENPKSYIGFSQGPVVIRS
ncbi:MAG: SPOR domain-containing protein [Muribaculaceae bacterium]|nr:SPOR domain-containing protein [Muribaculaceae bacterium]